MVSHIGIVKNRSPGESVATRDAPTSRCTRVAAARARRAKHGANAAAAASEGEGGGGSMTGGGGGGGITKKLELLRPLASTSALDANRGTPALTAGAYLLPLRLSTRYSAGSGEILPCTLEGRSSEGTLGSPSPRCRVARSKIASQRSAKS